MSLKWFLYNIEFYDGTGYWDSEKKHICAPEKDISDNSN